MTCLYYEITSIETAFNLLYRNVTYNIPQIKTLQAASYLRAGFSLIGTRLDSESIDKKRMVLPGIQHTDLHPNVCDTK